MSKIDHSVPIAVKTITDEEIFFNWFFLDRLDGLAKKKNEPTPHTMEDFLQVPDYYNMEDTSGKKRVRKVYRLLLLIRRSRRVRSCGIKKNSSTCNDTQFNFRSTIKMIVEVGVATKL